MALQFPWVASVYAVGGVVAAIIVGVAWRHRHRSGAAPLGVLAGGTTVWAAAALGNHVAATAATELLWLRLGIAVSGFVVVAWLVVVVTFTGREDWENPRGIAIAAVEPTVVALVVLTAGAGRTNRPSGRDCSAAGSGCSCGSTSVTPSCWWGS
jgi:MFS family permease